MASRPAPRSVRALIDTLDDAATGTEMHDLMRELYPLCRSITGDGLRRSLAILGRFAPLTLNEVPSGTQVFDWVVPKEWNLRGARLIGPDGGVIVDAARLNLHVLNYSAPFSGTMSLDELQEHLHSLPDRPTLVPYRTSYYQETWGLCLAHEQRMALRPGRYRVDIDTTLADGSLTYGELVLPGASTDEVLLSVHCCHPSLANDNLSGMAMVAVLARLLDGVRRRFTYRFLFIPGTIGAIAWLARNEDRARAIACGLVVAGVGDGGRFTYKKSRRGDTLIDRAVTHVLATSGDDHEIRDFTPYGYDERQYCSPGFDLAVGALTRTPYGEYPAYHTSADDLAFVRRESLAGSLRRYLEVIEVLEGDRRYVNTSPKGEPQLGRRGLYGTIGGKLGPGAQSMAMLWVLNLSDGAHSLLEIAERAAIPFPAVREAADALEAVGLLRPA